MTRIYENPAFAMAAQADFNRLGAADFIAHIRRPAGTATADMEATVAVLHGRVDYLPLRRSGHLMSKDNVHPQIWVNSDDRVCRQRVTIGHELGHYFVDVVARLPNVSPSDAEAWSSREAFCDYFAHRLLGAPECLLAQGGNGAESTGPTE